MIKTLAPQRLSAGRGPHRLVGNVVLERPRRPLENRGNGRTEALRMRRLLASMDAFPFRGALPGEARGASVRHGCLGPSGSYKRSEVSPESEEYWVATPGQDQRNPAPSWSLRRLTRVQGPGEAIGCPGAVGLRAGSLGRKVCACKHPISAVLQMLLAG